MLKSLKASHENHAIMRDISRDVSHDVMYDDVKVDIPPTNHTVIAHTTYYAKKRNQLSFKEGDWIKVLEMNDNGFWKGMIVGKDKIGYFPVTYTRSISNNVELTTNNRIPPNLPRTLPITAEESTEHAITINDRSRKINKKPPPFIAPKKNSLVDATSENYYSYQTLNVEYDPNSVTKYGLVSHYMSISSSIMMIGLGIVSGYLWFDSSDYLINAGIIYDKVYYLYSCAYCVGIGLLVFGWEWIFGIVRSRTLGIPFRSLVYLLIGIPTLWNYHTSLAGLFWLITSFFDGMAFKHCETQTRIKKRKTQSDYEGEVWFKCCSCICVQPRILHNSLHWFENLRNQSKIKKYCFVLVFMLFNIGYTLERGWFYYNYVINLNELANNGEDHSDYPAAVTTPILNAHNNGLILSPIWLPMAKMFGNLLDINCAFILLPVCRTFISKLYNISTDKSRKARCFDFIFSFIPLDKAIQWHKLMAFLMFIGTVIHTFAHYMNYNQVPLTYSTVYGETVWISGAIVLVCMHLMFTTSMLQVRHSQYEMFWYTHHLFIVFFIALLIHGKKSWNPNFWKWFVIPGLLYISERIMRAYRSGHAIGVRSVTHMNNAHAKVFCLELEKSGPISKFKEGQYVFVKIPIVSKYEWHPFTISSAPHEETMTLHIRNMGPGTWTHRVQEFYLALTNKKPHLKLYSRHGLKLYTAKTDPTGNNLISIDGPMAAPTQHLGKYETAVIIGAGIGVTPLRATLQSIVYFRFKHGVGNTYPNNAYCIWLVNHKQVDAYKFMCRTLKDAEDELHDMRVKNKQFMSTKNIKFHIYVTSVKDDPEHTTINMDEINCQDDVNKDLQNWGPHHDNNEDINDLADQSKKIKAPFCELDIYKNLKNPPKGDEPFVLGDIIFHRGRPKWKDLFLPLRKKYRGHKIGVMYCGPNVITNDLKIMCGKYTNHNTNTVFLLHKENF